MAKYNEYVMDVAASAALFQHLEEALKMNLTYCFKIVRDRVNGQIPFSYTYKDVAKKSLGQLITIFEKYNDNEGLYKALLKVKGERNHIAHKAYLLTVDEMRDEKTLSEEIARLNKIHGVVDAMISQLHQQGKKLEAMALGRNGET